MSHNWNATCEECNKAYSNIGISGGYWKGWNKLCKDCSGTRKGGGK